MNILIETLEKIKQGCKDVRKDKSIHKDARYLAYLVLNDCNKAIKEHNESK